MPKPFWTLSVEAKAGGEIFALSASAGRIFDQKKAKRLKNVLLERGGATVVSVEEKQGSSQRPTGLNTVSRSLALSFSLSLSELALHTAPFNFASR